MCEVRGDVDWEDLELLVSLVCLTNWGSCIVSNSGELDDFVLLYVD